MCSAVNHLVVHQQEIFVTFASIATVPNFSMLQKISGQLMLHTVTIHVTVHTEIENQQISSATKV